MALAEPSRHQEGSDLGRPSFPASCVSGSGIDLCRLIPRPRDYHRPGWAENAARRSLTELENKRLYDEYLDVAITYKIEWERELARRERMALLAVNNRCLIPITSS